MLRRQLFGQDVFQPVPSVLAVRVPKALEALRSVEREPSLFGISSHLLTTAAVK